MTMNPESASMKEDGDNMRCTIVEVDLDYYRIGVGDNNGSYYKIHTIGSPIEPYT